MMLLKRRAMRKLTDSKVGYNMKKREHQRGGGANQLRPPQRRLENIAAALKLKRTHRCVRLWPTRLSKCFLLYRRDNVENNVTSIELYEVAWGAEPTPPPHIGGGK